MNAAKTALLMFAIFALFMFIGREVGGVAGMAVALCFALLVNGAGYWFSDRIVLAMYRAHEVPRESAPRLHAIIERLCERAGLPKPRVYAIESPSPNAFATGRNPQHAAVAVTTGVLQMLTEDELEGVLAHELSHVGNRDILIGTLVATTAAAITFLANMLQWAAIVGGVGGRRRDGGGGNPLFLLVLAILAPIAAMLIQLWISRTREYAADARGARLAGSPLYLANALRKLEAGSQRAPLHADPATAHMFIVSPLTGKGLHSIFSTHPAIEDRIARLERMAAGGMHRD